MARAAVGPLALATLLAIGLNPHQTSSVARPAAPDAARHGGASCSATTPVVKTPGATDTLAVVRTPNGEVRVVSFERGWAVYNGHAPGTFLRVCVT